MRRRTAAFVMAFVMAVGQVAGAGSVAAAETDVVESEMARQGTERTETDGMEAAEPEQAENEVPGTDEAPDTAKTTEPEQAENEAPDTAEATEPEQAENEAPGTDEAPDTAEATEPEQVENETPDAAEAMEAETPGQTEDEAPNTAEATETESETPGTAEAMETESETSDTAEAIEAETQDMAEVTEPESAEPDETATENAAETTEAAETETPAEAETDEMEAAETETSDTEETQTEPESQPETETEEAEPTAAEAAEPEDAETESNDGIMLLSLEDEQDYELSVEEEIASQSGTLDELDYRIWIDSSRGENIRLYPTEEFTVSLNAENLDDETAYEIQWSLGTGEEESAYYTISEDGREITLNGAALSETYEPYTEFQLCAEVIAGGEAVSEASATIQLREEIYDYQIPNQEPGERSILPGDDLWISSELNCYVENPEYPNGENLSVTITDIEILGQYTWDGEEADIIALDQYEGEGWNIRGENYGYAKLKLTYTSVNEEEGSLTYGDAEDEEFCISVLGDIYTLSWDFPNDQSDMLTNSTMTVGSSLFHSYLENGTIQGEEITDYKLYVDSYDEELLTPEISEDEAQQVSITSNDQEADTCISVSALLPDENGEYNAVTSANLYVGIHSGYYGIEWTPLGEGVELGETLDLNQVNPTVYFYSTDSSEPERVENVRYRIEYDELAWLEQESESEIPPLLRRGNWATGVNLIAELQEVDEEGNPSLDEDGNENWYEICRREYRVDDMGYWTDFALSYGGENGVYIYTDKPVEVWFEQAEGSCEFPEDCTVTWEVHDEDGEELTYASFEKDGDKLILTANPGYTGKNVHIRGTIWYEGNDINTNELDIEVRDAGCEYAYQYTDTLAQLPNQNLGLEKTFEAEVHNAEYPYGENFEVSITNVTVENNPEDGAEDAVLLQEREDGSGWDLIMNTFGHAVVTLEHEDVLNAGLTQEFTFEIWVTGDVYGLNLSSNTGTSQLLPGNTLELTADVWWQSYDEENGEYSQDTSDFRVEWNVESGEEAIDILEDTEDPRIFAIQAKEDRNGWDVHIEARAYDTDENEVAYADFWIEIRDGYHQLIVEVDENLPVGMTGEITPHLLWFDGENPDGTEIENAVYRWDALDEEGMEIRDADGTLITFDEDGTLMGNAPFTVTRLVPWEVGGYLQAGMYNSEEDCFEFLSGCEVNLNGLDYSVYFENLYMDGYTWVFSDETLTISLNTDNLADKENVTLEWKVGYFNEETEEIESVWTEGDYWSADDAGITLNGAAFAEEGVTNFNLCVIVKAGDIVVDTPAIGVGVFESEESWDAFIQLLPDDPAISYQNKEMSYYLKNGAFPYGQEFVLTIENLESSNEEAVTCREEDGMWKISALPEGIGQEATLTYTVSCEELETFTLEQTIEVVAEKYVLQVYSKTDSDCMLPGASMDLGAYLFRGIYQEEISWEKIDAGSYQLSYEYDAEMVTVDENGTVTAREDAEGVTGIHVLAASLSEETPYQAEGWMTVYVFSDYYAMSEELVRVQPGDVLSITDVPNVLKHYTLDTPEGEVVEDKVLRFGEPGDTERLARNADGTELTILEDGVTAENSPWYTGIDLYALEDAEDENSVLCWGWCNILICAHAWDEGEVTQAATCTENGVKTYTCMQCGETKTESIAATGHSYSTEWTIDKAATCTATGEKSHHCTVCGAKTDVTTIEATGHDWDSGKVTKAATCTETGLKTYNCMQCGETKTESIAATGHSYSSTWTIDKAATCTTAGEKSHHCTVCGAKTDVTTIEATGHDWDAGKVTKAATCTETGVKTYTCTQCDETKTESIAATGHSYSTEWTIDKAATCTAAGEKSHHCTVCGAKTDVTTIAATGHSWDSGKVTKAATCTETGVKTYTCTQCGGTKTESIAATGHSYSTEWTVDKAATCTTAGEKSHHCTVCGAKTDVTTIAATGHTWSAWTESSPATVFAPAEKERKCTVCGETETAAEGKKLTPTLQISQTTLTMEQGKTVTNVKVTGLAAGDSIASWKSSSTSIVTVKGNADGTCTITSKKKAGTATITITLASGLKGTVTVKVNAAKTTSVKLNKTKLSLQKGKTATLKATVKPSTSTEKVTYTSSNKKIATVTSKGVVKAVSPGTAKITVKSGSKKAVCTVTVTGIKTKKITNVKKTITLKKGKSVTLKPKLSPSGSTEKITYKSSNKKVATVSSKGKILAKKKGTAVITVTSGKVSVKCTVKVK
ncbi:MAG: Ig-like domain-containing protein [Eubacteriales bacterium]|nr:Ig-like domain-containing protein [Eubacteriales bacterium]